MEKRRFKITQLESRIAPAATGLIPSVNLSDRGVNGAEHACKGLSHNHVGDRVWYRHGCAYDCDCVPTPPPPPPPPPPPCCC